MKNSKEKIYHKLINNEFSYNTKPIIRYRKNDNKNISNISNDKISQLKKLKIQMRLL